MSSAIQAALSAIHANQVAIDTVSQNIANANTPGYHRQVVNLRPRQSLDPGNRLSVGDGVEVAGINQVRSELVEQAVSQNISSQSAISAELGIVRQIETLVNPIDGSLADRIQEFFNGAERLSSAPQDANLRRTVLGQAVNLADEFNSLSRSLQQISADTRNEVNESIKQINELSLELSELNPRIRISEQGSAGSLALRDRRDQVITELAALIDVELRADSAGNTVALLGGHTAVVGETKPDLRVSLENGELLLTQGGIEREVAPVGGRLAGLIEGYNRRIPAFVDRLDTLAREFSGLVDSIHSEGVGLDGSFQTLTSERPVTSIGIPLSQSVSGLPVQSGELFVSVTATETGVNRIERIVIDPQTQSLQDFATALSSIDRLSAVVAPQTGQLFITAEPGYTFDFTGQLEQLPSDPGFTGTSAVAVSGSYSGEENDQLTFSVVGTGTVGLDENLQVEVRNSAGELLNSLEIGRGYAPGTELEVGNGVAVSFGVGTVNSADTLGLDVIADPDTANVLAALGLNTLFSGATASDLKVSARLRSDPSAFAASRTGQPGDSGNLLRLAVQRDSTLVDGTGLTTEQYLADIVTESGHRVNDLQIAGDQLLLVGESLSAERDSISGVNTDEELLKLLKHQRGFQAAAQLISVVERTLDDLLRTLA